MDGSGAPIANEIVRVSFQGGQETNYTTNEEGRARFALNTSMLYFDSVGIGVSPAGRGGHEVTHRAGRGVPLKFLLYMQKHLPSCSWLFVPTLTSVWWK